jgi:hypothetical protein
MGINAVLSYLQTTLDGETLAGLSPVEVHVIPMPVLRNGMPEPLRLYIWPDRVRITQPTMSGTAGYRREAHSPLMMALRQTVGQKVSVEQFPVLVDGLLSVVMKLGANIPITDKITGAQSYITFIGTEFNVQFRYPRMTLDMRPVTLVCEIGCSVQEQMVP